VRFLKDFFIAVVEEWKGWITGSLPMAAIAAIALIKPQIAPLPIWEWLILIFVAGFSCAAFRVYRTVRLAEIAAVDKLNAICQERPFTYMNMGAHARQPDGRHDLWQITRIELYFENLGERMLQYLIKELDVEINGIRAKAGVTINEGGYIHARQQQIYGMDISHDGLATMPLTVTFRFMIEYDNVPGIFKRITERKVRYIYTSFKPVTCSNVILFQDER
jgi:hypothetical protein